MKVKLRVTVNDVGKDGEVVDVPDAEAQWLIGGGYAVDASKPAPNPTPTPRPSQAPTPAPPAEQPPAAKKAASKKGASK